MTLALVAILAAVLWTPAIVHHVKEWRSRHNFLSLGVVSIVIVAVMQAISVFLIATFGRPLKPEPLLWAVLTANLTGSLVYLLALRWHKKKYPNARRPS